ncbi:DNA repair protein RecO [Psychrobacter sp. M13]|uniref:DNA repair protein RecO n=1 Tax=Psychrobacter sp. M13 TaxID=3067275 RepID=UPI00273C768A|nr:DNA repair protein RecO C-terminal domain-containing protein [Psychrobacter sp. M13]WLP94942.1 DNA repair protein RecO C-terminal domain-containing protein [Psychrobacter sp. M13]
MRNEALNGYLLHQRPYQEKRALYYLFSEHLGIVHGIGKKGAPLFEPLQLFATGKRDLKTFSQITISPIEVSQLDKGLSSDISNNSVSKKTQAASSTPQVLTPQPQRYQQITGQQQYAALYLNEILLKLLPVEDPAPALWHHYQHSLLTLKQSLSADELRLCLRQFEQNLFQELGFALNLTQDSMLDNIEADNDYRFLPDIGLMPIIQYPNIQHNDIQNTDQVENTNLQAIFKGSEILAMEHSGITIETLNSWSRLYKHLIDHLVDYQPLQSRLLWQQQQRYQ